MTFKLINKSYTGIDALGANADSNYNMGYVFYGQKKEISFRLGNLNTYELDYKISASGTNTDLVEAVDFSKDRILWDSYVTHSGIGPNGISDITYCRFTCPDDAYLTSGTFHIQVDEIYG